MPLLPVPIACSLAPDGLQDRIAEWRAVLASDIEHVAAAASAARLRLRGGDDVLVRLVDLAEREQACCAFFGFSVELQSGRRWLCITVPDGAEGVLADLVSLPPSAELAENAGLAENAEGLRRGSVLRQDRDRPGPA